jgi:hypothetical protein
MTSVPPEWSSAVTVERRHTFRVYRSHRSEAASRTSRSASSSPVPVIRRYVFASSRPTIELAALDTSQVCSYVSDAAPPVMFVTAQRATNRPAIVVVYAAVYVPVEAFVTLGAGGRAVRQE